MSPITPAEIKALVATDGMRVRVTTEYEPDPNTGCWLWTGALNAYGYGTITAQKRTLYAHRVAYEIMNGPAPSSLSVRHKCDTRCCINPEHLTLGTHQDNMRDVVGKRAGMGMRPFKRVNAAMKAKIDASAHLPVRASARLLGLAPSTVRAHRKSAIPTPPAVEGEAGE